MDQITFSEAEYQNKKRKARYRGLAKNTRYLHLLAASFNNLLIKSVRNICGNRAIPPPLKLQELGFRRLQLLQR